MHTGEFGSSATPTVNAPIQKVQTGGFGDPNGIPGQGKSNAHLVAASTGAFDLPQGAGSGNGAGGAKGIKGTIASAGFGNGIAVGRTEVTAVVTEGEPQFKPLDSPRNSSLRVRPGRNRQRAGQPQHLWKSSPSLIRSTLRKHGISTCKVKYYWKYYSRANGQLHVNRVVQGMGHGLDEAAISAANKMRFKPAQHYNQPIDSTAIVHVVFQLAY